VSVAGVLACIAATPFLAQMATAVRLELTLERARLIVNTPRQVPVRLTAPGSGTLAQVARVLAAAESPGNTKLAATLMRYATGADDVDAARAIGTAHLLGGDPEKAASAFSRVPESDRDVWLWSDLAAAETMAAIQANRHDRWLAALTAADRALALDPHHHEAQFNRAVVVDAVGVIPVARRHWEAYIRADSSSHWSAIARDRLSALPLSDRDAWAAAVRDMGNISRVDLNRLIERSPEFARLNAEGPLLAAWADALRAGDAARAQRELDAARHIARIILKRSGETLLADAVAAIDRGVHSADLARGHVAYRNGRVAYSRDDLVTAERELRAAAAAFARTDSPMEALATLYVAATLFDRNEIEQAEAILQPLLTQQRRSGVRYKTLTARILHQIALCEAVRGHWSASLAAAEESASIYRALGEPVNAAAAEAIVSEDFDFLGQSDRARRHGMSALRGSSAEDLYRARVILAALARTELRGRRWDWARALVGVEQELAALYPHARLDSDMFVRLAAAGMHAGRTTNARQALHEARRAAARIADEAMRLRFLSDVDAAEGTLNRDSNPAEAVRLLTAAIEFQRSATRPLLLPELLLQRGRAHLQLNDFAAARGDFEAGIVELERQRTYVSEAELRPGLFDDAAELFEETIALHLKRDDDAAALAYVERGRARTMLEEMEGAFVTPLPILDVQQRLGRNVAVVAYMPLRKHLAIFVVTHNRVVSRTVDVPRIEVARAVADFLDALTKANENAHVREASASLYGTLVAPIEGDLSGIDTIAFVPDGTLQRVAFAALFDRRRRTWLIERYVISTAPSSTLYVAAGRAAAQASPTPPTAVVFANPAIPRNEYPDLPSLEGAEYDAQIVAASYTRATILTRNGATATRFLQTAPRYGVVHFAGHGVTDEHDPARSALVFAASGQTGGSVTLSQIARIRFDATTQVVVLAACSTMAGRNAAVEGVSSLARAFLVAGVPSVIGTLWDIDDREAATVVRPLHAGLARGAAPAIALRAAQLAAIRSIRPHEREPRRWAAFAAAGAATTSDPAQIARRSQAKSSAASTSSTTTEALRMRTP
jgi:CHAT domain-containing protein